MQALESSRTIKRSAADFSDAELVEILAPVFDGRVPSDDELHAFIASSRGGEPK